MTFRLGMLGPYRVERTVEYMPGGSDNSYAEMIRVRKSRDNPPNIPGPFPPLQIFRNGTGPLSQGKKESMEATGKDSGPDDRHFWRRADDPFPQLQVQ